MKNGAVGRESLADDDNDFALAMYGQLRAATDNGRRSDPSVSWRSDQSTMEG